MKEAASFKCQFGMAVANRSPLGFYSELKSYCPNRDQLCIYPRLTSVFHHNYHSDCLCRVTSMTVTCSQLLRRMFYSLPQSLYLKLLQVNHNKQAGMCSDWTFCPSMHTKCLSNIQPLVLETYNTYIMISSELINHNIS